MPKTYQAPCGETVPVGRYCFCDVCSDGRVKGLMQRIRAVTSPEAVPNPPYQPSEPERNRPHQESDLG